MNKDERYTFAPSDRILGVRLSFLRVIFGGLAVVFIIAVAGVLTLIASFAWSGRVQPIDDAGAWARRALEPLNGPIPIDLRNASGYGSGVPKSYTLFFEIAPLGNGQAATAAEIERRLISNGFSTIQGVDIHGYRRRESDDVMDIASDADRPGWWPSTRQKTIYFQYRIASVQLMVLPDGRTFGYNWVD